MCVCVFLRGIDYFQKSVAANSIPFSYPFSFRYLPSVPCTALATFSNQQTLIFSFLSCPGEQLSVLTDRGQVGASLAPGQMELMVQRRLLADDNKGVGEPLDETVGGMGPYPNWERLVIVD